MKKALGKGIKAFIPEELGILKDEKFADVDIELVKPNPDQPRLDFNDDAIEELAASIREAGVLQPIVVVPESGFYKIIIGERRWRAAQKAGLRKIPVLVRHIPREGQLEISLIENLQREQLNPVEVAMAYHRLMDELGYTQQEVAEKVGKDRVSVTNTLRLLKLAAEIQEHIRAGRLSMGHAKAILAVEDERGQIELARRIISKGLSVREAEAAAAGRKLASDKPRSKRRLDPNLESVQEELLRVLGTKVTIDGTAKKGVIRVHYYTLEDLNRIFDLIKGAKA
ncbi:MAG: ParB/RepB/Spo0J family partition protein [Candidatus Aminicenantes bacterium]|nr:ParB/RepB/Spo0J family partition protein [Candidatus Aminicenantes bacterium]